MTSPTTLKQYSSRFLGVVLGIALIVFGSMAVFDDAPYRPRHILILLNLLAFGAVFLSYGATGKKTPILPRGMAGVWLLLLLGTLLIAVGIYTVAADPSASMLGKIVLAVGVLYGVATIFIALERRKRLMAERST
jgi:hypothetical protein